VNPVFFHEKPGRRTSCSFGASGVSRKFNFESFNKTPQGRTAVLSALAMRVALLFAAAVLPVALSANPAFNHIAGLHLNASSFYTTLHAGDAGRWFLLFFSRNCGHCAALLPAWQELEERLGASVRAVRLGAIDAESEKVVADRVDIHGFPTLMAIEAGWLYEYHGGRSADEMLAFVESDDLAAVAKGSRRLAWAPSSWDPLLRVPDALREICGYAVQTSPLAAALLATALICVGMMLARATTPLDAPFVTVACPEGVLPGQSFVVEFVSGRTRLWPRGRTKRMRVEAPPGIHPGQTFFVPLMPAAPARAPDKKGADKKD
jgi:thiol-disulfide isomerase/thioredoxin